MTYRVHRVTRRKVAEVAVTGSYPDAREALSAWIAEPVAVALTEADTALCRVRGCEYVAIPSDAGNRKSVRGHYADTRDI